MGWWTQDEIMAGLTLSTRALALPDRPEVPDADRAVIEKHFHAAVHHEEPNAERGPAWRAEAQQKLGSIISALTEPYRRH